MRRARWHGNRLAALLEVAKSRGCGADGAAELSRRLGESVSADAMDGAWRRYRGADLAAEAPVANPSPERISSVSFMVKRAEGYLVVPDLQAPFHAPGGLDFVERVRREFAIPKDNVLLAGDEVDNFHGKGADKKQDPDALHTPAQELLAAKEELRRWYSAYPNVRVARSNHGTRYERRASEANISSQWMKLYRDVIEAPLGWQWQDRWIIHATKQPFVLEHGHEGATKTEGKVLENGYSTVHGHQTQAQITWLSNHLGRRLWGMCVGGLIDHDTYAFAYAKKYRRRTDNGVGVILDGGRIPLWVPYFG